MLIDPYRDEGGGSTDPFFDDVVLLLTGNTGAIVEWVGGGTTTEVGDVELSTDEVLFGTHSIRNTQSSPFGETDGIIVTDSGNPDRFTFDGEFTIEGWFFPITIGGLGVEALTAIVTSSANFGAARYALEITNLTDARVVRFRRSTTVICSSDPGAIATDVWQHIAVTRDALDNIRIFMDGVEVASGTYTGTLGGADSNGDAKLNIAIGVAVQLDDFLTYLDQIRVTRRCRYTAAFTPPDAPFPTS